MFIIAAVACSNTDDSASPTPELPTATPESPVITTATPESAQPVLPVFSVSTIDGETLRLEDLLGTVPVYLVFIPSTTDERDRKQMQLLQSQIGEFDELNAEVVVVVSDLPTRVIDMRDELGLNFPLIADPLHVVASDWQVFDLDNNGESTPASFVFDAHGNLMARLVAAELDDRPSVNEVLYVIEESLSSGAA